MHPSREVGRFELTIDRPDSAITANYEVLVFE